MMFKYSFDDELTAGRIETAVRRVIARGLRTGDIWTEGCERVSCSAMGDAVVAAL